MRTFFNRATGNRRYKVEHNFKQINLDCFRNMTVVSNYSKEIMR